MGRKISRKKQSVGGLYKSRKIFQQKGAGHQAFFTPGGVIQRNNVNRASLMAKGDFSDSILNKHDNIRKMIEDLSYDGKNLARYKDRKKRAYNMREAGMNLVRDTSKKKKGQAIVLVNKIKSTMNSIDRFSQTTGIEQLSGNAQPELFRLVIECRKQGLKAIRNILDRDISYLNEII